MRKAPLAIATIVLVPLLAACGNNTSSQSCGGTGAANNIAAAAAPSALDTPIDPSDFEMKGGGGGHAGGGHAAGGGHPATGGHPAGEGNGGGAKSGGAKPAEEPVTSGGASRPFSRWPWFHGSHPAAACPTNIASPMAR